MGKQASVFTIQNSSFTIHHSSFSLLLGFSDNGSKDGDELISLVQQFGQARLGNEFGRCEKAEPVVRLTGFFAGDGKLTQKVRPALASLTLFDVRTNRRA